MLTYHAAVGLQRKSALIAISGLEPVLVNVLVPVAQPRTCIRLNSNTIIYMMHHSTFANFHIKHHEHACLMADRHLYRYMQ